MVLAVVLCLRPVRRVVVSGDSMRPTLEPGDRLLVVRGPVRVGGLVAFTDPREPGRTLVKRVTARGAHDVEVRGDNSVASTDSRHFGPVPDDDVRGRPVYRYLPEYRRGRL